MNKNNREVSHVFVGSSKESLSLAYALQKDIDVAEVTVWKQGIFELSKSSLESLENSLTKFDFAVFIFAPDDISKIRNNQFATVRDNVVFELGMFIGYLGSERCYVVAPDDIPDLHLPSDLLGIAAATYKSNTVHLSDLAKLGPAAFEISQQITRLGRFSKGANAQGATQQSLSIADWTQVCDKPHAASSPWIIDDSEIELNSPYIGPNAYYIWNNKRLRDEMRMSFTAAFHPTGSPKPDFPDLRLALFGASSTVTYHSSRHLLLHIPWECDQVAFAAVVGLGDDAVEVSKSRMPLICPWNQKRDFEVVISDRVSVRCGGTECMRVDLPKVIDAGVDLSSDWHWGFSTIGGHIRILRLIVDHSGH